MSADPDKDRSTLLEGLVFQTLERMERDGSAAIDAAASEHPALEADLRKRLQALQAMGLVPAEPTRPLDIPKRLGPYEIGKTIGLGGMGVVLEGWDTILSRTVAIKVIRPEFLASSSLRKRFTRECQIVARLQDPGIARIFDAGEEGTLPFMVMERVDGCTLAQALDQLADRDPSTLRGLDLQDAVRQLSPEPRTSSGPVTLFEGSWSQACVRIARVVAEGLAHAHAAGVLHRDVKSSNVMITPQGRVLLIDFGLARMVEAVTLTATGGRLGSLPYTAPERVDGRTPPSAAADIYGLGVVLYELLSLKLPFRASTEAALVQSILKSSPEPLRSVVTGLPRHVAETCERAMRKDPARRPPTAAAMAGDLSRALAGRAPVPHGDGALEALRSRWRARPVATAAILASVVLGLALPTAIVSVRVHAAEKAAVSEAHSITRLELALHAADELQMALPVTDLVDDTEIDDLRHRVLAELVDLRSELLEDDKLGGPEFGALRRDACLGQAEALQRLGRGKPLSALLDRLARPSADVPLEREGSWARARHEALLASLPDASGDTMQRAALALRAAADSGATPFPSWTRIRGAELALAAHRADGSSIASLESHAAGLIPLRDSGADTLDASALLLDLRLAQAALARKEEDGPSLAALVKEASLILAPLDAALSTPPGLADRRTALEALQGAAAQVEEGR